MARLDAAVPLATTGRTELTTPVVPVVVVVAGLAVAGFAARPPVTSTSTELPTVVAALGGSSVLTGLVSSLPPLVFAAGSFGAPRVLSRVGVARTLVLAGLLAAVGLAGRVALVRVPVFLAGTFVALTGVALANVALPTAVKRYLPGRTGPGTAAYTLMLAGGTAVAAAATVPLGSALGGWRVGLGMWAAVSGVAALPWLALARRESRGIGSGGVEVADAGSQAVEVRGALGGTGGAGGTGAVDPGAGPGPRGVGVVAVARTPIGRAVGTLFAGQAASTYVLFAYLPSIAGADGRSRAEAGLLLGWFSLLGVVSSGVPLLTGRLRDQRGLIVALAAGWVAGDLGLAFAPSAAWLWATLAGLGASLFTLALTLIPLRAATVAGSAALAAFAQGIGYLTSAVVVFAAGVLHDAVGSWDPVLLGMALLMVPVSVAGLRVGLPAVLEQQVRAARRAGRLSRRGR